MGSPDKRLRYYILNPSMDPQTTGVETRQITGLFDKRGLNQSAIDHYNEKRQGFLSEQEIDLHNFMLDPKSRLTDVLSSDFLRLDGFFVSEKFKNTTEKARSGPLRFYPTTLYLNGTKAGHYYFMNVLDFLPAQFEKSVFVVDKRMELLRNGGKQIHISDMEDFKTKLSDLTLKDASLTILPKTLFLNTKPDLLLLPTSTSLFCSEGLKALIEREKLSGVEFKESDIAFYMEG